MNSDNRGYLSVIGSNFLPPITSLIEEMESHDPKGPNEVQASPMENGFAVSIIALLILMLESYLSRTQFMKNIVPPKRNLDFVNHFYFDYFEFVTELYVIRDVIAHNHLWEADMGWNEKFAMKLYSAEISKGFGDKKYRRVVDNQNRKTKNLGLNLFPTRINKQDVIIVLYQVLEVLLHIEKEDRNLVYISDQYVKYKGAMIKFVDLRNLLS